MESYQEFKILTPTFVPCYLQIAQEIMKMVNPRLS